MVVINGNDKSVEIPWSRYTEITKNMHQGINIFNHNKITIGESITVPEKEAIVVLFEK